MTANEIRKTFLDFFNSKEHHIVPSSPMIVKNDPSLMFINSGMAPFKDVFLGNAPIKHPRVADTQKCLRVSGKHNDLEDVGIDTYHHTMFEMLGNWSFGDYFKKDAIAWAWELLTDVYKIDKSRLYVTVFEGSAEDKLDFDQEAFDYWKEFIPEERILKGNKKDNFWEMGDQGPCGPCSEIHYDGRSDAERLKVNGASLVNNDDPQVIEVWNNVFMEFNRKADGSLEKLPNQHVDTGMGFERLVRVLQGKQSNYDTDVFTPIINEIEKISSKKYAALDLEKNNLTTQKTNIAIRVIADHIRTIAFSIADGQLPSNNGAGYVIRRILRRAIRYGYQALDIKEPFMYQLVKVLSTNMGEAFPEIKNQCSLIEKVIREEELSFLRTLENGIKRMDAICADFSLNKKNILSGDIVFELYDTYGFPLDLTSLIARENNLTINEEEFKIELQKQKDRSRAAATIDTDDWVIIKNENESNFVGYDLLESKTNIIKYRKIKQKGKELFQLVLSSTPFYAESGGQIGDTGTIENINEVIEILDTKKENGITVHFTNQLPVNLNNEYFAKVNSQKRLLTENNHSATHLLHAALRNVLGTHVEQKGSLVNNEYLRFDFSHFSKLLDHQLYDIEKIVNEKVRENILSSIQTMSIEDAKKTGAMALFGEKYGDEVRVVTFDKNFSIELCGGTHVKATGQIGTFKIISESAVAAGIRRIEAITAISCENYINGELDKLNEIKEILKNSKDLSKAVSNILEENNLLHKEIEAFQREKANAIKLKLKSKIQEINGASFIGEKIDLNSAELIKDLSFQLKSEFPNLLMVLGAELNGKASLSVAISDALVKDKNLNASVIVREIAKQINGGGGGQAFYATAGGTDINGIEKALSLSKNYLN